MKELPEFKYVIMYKIENNKVLSRLVDKIVEELEIALELNKDEIVIIDRSLKDNKNKAIIAHYLIDKDYIFYFEGSTLKIILNEEWDDNNQPFLDSTS